MSKPRYDWWPYVKGMIRRYPELKEEYEDLHRQTVTQQLSGMPGGGSASRTVELCAIRELPTTNQREYEAVRRAISQTERAPHTGSTRIKIIELMYWKRTRTLEGAAMEVNVSYQTARNYHGEFIRLVAKNYGLMDI